METVLLEAFCRACELSYDLWAELHPDGERFDIARHDLHCPNCMSLVAAGDIRPKENLA
jgi:hypothetical protein